MNMRVIDLLIIGGTAAVFLLPLLMGYFGFGSPNHPCPSLKKSVIGIAVLQLVVLIFFGWLFGTSVRHVNHIKWIAPLLFVDVLMWVCFGIGFVVAALRYRFKNKA